MQEIQFIAPVALHDEMLRLRNEKQMDFLESLTGMDWGAADEAGGMYESLNYANFGIQEALLFRIAWINTHPGQNPGNIPQLAKLPSYFSQVCYPRTGMLHSLNFGDSHKNVSAESSMMLLYALGMKDPTILWSISQVEQGQHRDGYFLNRPMGFLYTPDLSKAPAIPQLPTSQLFSDFGWATMRNSWEKDATMLAVKSGHTWNHSHADANSFIIFHKGVDIIKDGGNCWYPNPAYRNYFFQSQAHNVVQFNGEGQPREQQYSGSTLRGYLYHLLDAGNVKYVLANGTGPVSNNFSRNFRHFLWMDDVIYMIDDLKTHKVGRWKAWGSCICRKWMVIRFMYNVDCFLSGLQIKITNYTRRCVNRISNR